MGSHLSKAPAIGRVLAALLVIVSLAEIAVAIGAPPAGASTEGDQIVRDAAAQAGVSYCDGGGGIHGPSHGNKEEPGCEGNTAGFDCMTLAQYAVYQATGIVLPSDGTQLSGVGRFIPPEDSADLLPGDVVYWGRTLDDFEHSGIYAGDGKVWDALKINAPVQMHTWSELTALYSYDGAIRYSSALSATSGWVTYTGAAGVTFEYPASWTVKHGTTGALYVYIDPAGQSPFRRNINLVLQANPRPLTATGSLQENKEQIRRDHGIISQQASVNFDGTPGYRVVWAVTINGSRYEFLSQWTVRQGKAWLFTYTADHSRFGSVLPKVKTLLATLELPS
jgi:cell wall-associated NlpC family hydrolase